MTITAKKGARLVGRERDQMIGEIVKEYKKGKVSIRDLADRHGRSYGFVHRVLSEADGVEIRQRGGARKTKVSR